MKHTIAVIMLLIIFGCLVISSMLQQSGTSDEIAHHIPAGYSYLKKWDFRINPSNPPLSRYIMALPLLFLDLKAPFDDKSWEGQDTAVFGRKFFFEYNREKVRLILFLSRLPMVAVGVLAGFLVYMMASQFYGKTSGVFALFLFVLSPELLAHSGLATTDITAACFMLFAMYAFWRFMTSPTPLQLFSAGIALGLAQLSKYSALILYPIFILLTALEYFRQRKIGYRIWRNTMAIFFVSVIIIWLGYGFKIKPFLAETTRKGEKAVFVKNLGTRLFPFWNKEISDKTDTILRDVPLPLTTYVTGIFGVMKHNKEGHTHFFLGKWYNQGQLFYYAAAFLIKTPIPIILFLLIATITLLKTPLSRYEYYIIIPLVIIFVAASFGKIQLGLRYILPIYPLSFIFTARIIPLIKFLWQRIIFFLLAIWLAIANIIVWPHYLSYFNEFIGGPDNGWKYLRDSNMDWGQDLPSLSRYITEHRINEIVTACFGEDDPSVYGIKYRRITEGELSKPLDKVYAVSVQGIEKALWTKDHIPTAKAGYSIFIYDFRKDGLENAR